MLVPDQSQHAISHNLHDVIGKEVLGTTSRNKNSLYSYWSILRYQSWNYSYLARESEKYSDTLDVSHPRCGVICRQL